MNAKHLILSVMFALMALTSNAEALNTLVIKFSDETSTKVLLTEDVQGTFVEGNLVFSGESTSVSVKQSDIKSFQFEYGASSSIETVESLNGEVSVNGGVIYISNLPENSNVSIYNVSGQTVAKYVGAGQMQTEQLNAGLYVVTINNKSLKLVVK